LPAQAVINSEDNFVSTGLSLPALSDPDFVDVATAWHTLSEPIKAGILAMVKAAR
jgi:hypothetical protein